MARKKARVWKPDWDDILRLVEEQNPWASTGTVPEVWAPAVERPLAVHLWKRLKVDQPRRFQLILGPRRVGKTTCMYQTVRRLLREGIPRGDIWWLRLDHPLLMGLQLGELVKVILRKAGAEPIYLFLDELTYAPEWDLWLKTFYDDQWPVRIVGSSSATAALRDRTLESGVGRWEEQYLSPYLFGEYLPLAGRKPTLAVEDSFYLTLRTAIEQAPSSVGLEDLRRRYLLTGGFPELLLLGKQAPPDDASTLLQSQRTLKNDAIERAIYKDIPQAFDVENPLLLERLLYTLAGQITGILSPNSICQALGGLSQPTFDRYLSYLEKAFLLFTLPNFSGSEVSVQKRGRKLYFVDGAVRNAALQRGLAPLNDDAEMGLLVENMVASHLHALSRQTQVRLHHWRDKNHEVDLVYDHPDTPLAFEVTVSGSHSRMGLLAFSERFERFKGGCYLVSPSVSCRPPEKGTLHEVGTIPLDLFLEAVSRQTEQELENNLSARARQA